MKQDILFCCEEHMDMAFDDFLLNTETFPNVLKITSHQCSYCHKNAEYVLKAFGNIQE